MSKRPTFFYSSPEVSYFELGDYFAARYDFTDESAAIYLVDATTQEFAILGYHRLHALWRFVNQVIDSAEGDCVALMTDFENECERLIQNAIEEREDEAAAEDECEANWQREHENGLRASSRYI